MLPTENPDATGHYYIVPLNAFKVPKLLQDGCEFRVVATPDGIVYGVTLIARVDKERFLNAIATKYPIKTNGLKPGELAAGETDLGYEIKAFRAGARATETGVMVRHKKNVARFQAEADQKMERIKAENAKTDSDRL